MIPSASVFHGPSDGARRTAQGWRSCIGLREMQWDGHHGQGRTEPAAATPGSRTIPCCGRTTPGARSADGTTTLAKPYTTPAIGPLWDQLGTSRPLAETMGLDAGAHPSGDHQDGTALRGVPPGTSILPTGVERTIIALNSGLWTS
jgi:hypothetical protein